MEAHLKTSLLNASALSLALTIGLAPGILVPAAHAQDRTPATQDQQRQRRAQTEPAAEPRTGSNTTIAEEGSIPIPPETKSETKHDWTGGGHTIHYTATAGNLLIKDENDKANGSIFYVAYTCLLYTSPSPRDRQ